MRSLCLAVFSVILGAVFSIADAAPKTIRVTLQMTPESLLYKNLQIFKEQVAKESHGELDIQLFPSSQLYKAQEVPKAVGSGQIEMGAVLLSQYADTLPVTDIFAIPFLFSIQGLFEAAIKPESGVRSTLDEAIRAGTGAKVLWWDPIGSEVLVSKGSPLLSPADIAGKKVRVSGFVLAKLIEACGGTPVITSGTETYGVLKRGDVDAVSTGTESFVSRKLWEVADHMTILHHTRQIFIVLINDNFLLSLPENQQRIIRNAALEAGRRVENQDVEGDRQAIAVLLQHRVKVVEAGPDGIEKWKTCSSPVSEAFLERAGAPGYKAMSEYRKLILNVTQNMRAKNAIKK